MAKNKIKEHNIIEKKIKADIIKKNTIRKKLQKQINMVLDYNKLLNNTKCDRKKKRYIAGIKRFMINIGKNKIIVSDLIKNLEKRILDEMKYSESEIKELQDSYKKEFAEMISAEEKLNLAKVDKLTDDEKKEIAGIFGSEDIKEVNIPKEFILAKLSKKVKKEKKDVKNVEKELKSEEKDKILFQNEIKRMGLEKVLLMG